MSRLASALVEQLKVMEPRQRAVFRLLYLQGLNPDDAARTIDVPRAEIDEMNRDFLRELRGAA